MNVLSLFDGISCGQIALGRAGIKYENYFSSEIDEYAIKVTMSNYPKTIQIGDISRIIGGAIPDVKLLIGGSPCQGFSFSGKQLNFEDPRSKLFFEYVRILEEVKPKYFLLENVKMKKEYQDIISGYLGVEPIEINSALVSAQNRKRLYWTNIPNIIEPEDSNITLEDVVNIEELYHEIKINHPETIVEGKNYAQYDQSLKGHNSQDQRYFYLNGKSNCITRSRSSIPKIKIGDTIYLLNIKDVESLQNIPKGYTSNITKAKRFEAVGNGWTVDIIAHIFKNAIFD